MYRGVELHVRADLLALLGGTISAVTQVVTVHTELDFSEWEIEKRARPLSPPGADEAEFEEGEPAGKKPDKDEELFGEEPKPATPAPGGRLAFQIEVASGQGPGETVRAWTTARSSLEV